MCASPSHSILTPGQPVPELILKRQEPGRAATGVPIVKYDSTWKIARRKRERTPDLPLSRRTP